MVPPPLSLSHSITLPKNPLFHHIWLPLLTITCFGYHAPKRSPAYFRVSQSYDQAGITFTLFMIDLVTLYHPQYLSLYKLGNRILLHVHTLHATSPCSYNILLIIFIIVIVILIMHWTIQSCIVLFNSWNEEFRESWNRDISLLSQCIIILIISHSYFS